MSRVLIALAATAAVLGMAGPMAMAQQPPGPGGQQQSDLPTLLHLRPDQMTAFHTFQAASQPHPDEVARMHGASPQAIAGLTTPQRLDKIGALLNTQVEVFHRSADATRAFYGQLSPDQQHTFDRLTAPPASQARRSQY